MSTLAKLRRQDDGFTLVEVLVGMSIAIIVLFATLQSLDLFTSNANQQTRVTDANDQVRRTMDRTVRDLRGASLIVRASSTDLVYYVPEPTGVRMERLCVTSDDLYYASLVAATAPAAPTAGCATGTKVATLRSTTSTAFTYDGASTSATPGTVKNVGITFSLDASGGGRTATSTCAPARPAAPRGPAARARRRRGRLQRQRPAAQPERVAAEPQPAEGRLRD